jgi:hypothetical protein
VGVQGRKGLADLQRAYDHFNKLLFEGLLPGALITLQRKSRASGYYSHENFVARDRRPMDSADEIALNPDAFAGYGDTEIMQTLVHEMVHQWQYHCGIPSRGGYHNRQWASKMESVGLMPSDTGGPGGKKTGPRMSDYPIEGGRFDREWRKLRKKGFEVHWEGRDRTRAGVSPDNPRPISKVKSTCPRCEINVWGKPGLSLICGHCHESDGDLVYLEESPESGS